MKYFLTILTGSILLSSCINQQVTESTVFNPIKEYELSGNFGFERQFIQTTDTTKIETWYITESNPELNLIYFSGNGSNIRSAIPFFNELGEQMDLNIFSFNYSGFGLSTGQPTISGIVNDAERALKYFQEINVNEDIPTVVLGYSLGGFVALNVLNQDVIDNGIIMSSFSSLDELESYLLKEALPGVIRPFLKLEIDKSIYQLDNVSLVKQTEKPILFIHGGADEFIPPSMSYDLYNLSPSKNKGISIIDKADHRMVLKDSASNKLVIAEIKKFLSL